MPNVQPELFDIEQCTAENNKALQKKEEQKRRAFYQTVDLPYFANPQNDEEKLFSLQYKYLKSGDITARQDMYKLSYQVMKRILWAYMKNGRLGWMDDEAQNDIVSEAFLYVFRRFENGTGYVVKKSFISVLKGGIKHALEYTTMKDKELSLSDVKNITWKAKGIYS